MDLKSYLVFRPEISRQRRQKVLKSCVYDGRIVTTGRGACGAAGTAAAARKAAPPAAMSGTGCAERSGARRVRERSADRRRERGGA